MLHEVAIVIVESPLLGTLLQEFQINKKTGRFRNRNTLGMSETIEKGESSIDAAIRGLEEELELEIDKNRLEYLSHQYETKPSPSTGELKTYSLHRYKLSLSYAEAINLNLIADEEYEKTYFRWV